MGASSSSSKEETREIVQSLAVCYLSCSSRELCVSEVELGKLYPNDRQGRQGREGKGSSSWSSRKLDLLMLSFAFCSPLRLPPSQLGRRSTLSSGHHIALAMCNSVAEAPGRYQFPIGTRATNRPSPFSSARLFRRCSPFRQHQQQR